MRLQTPEKIRSLQRTLYRKAKAEPDVRFSLLYDKIHRDRTEPEAGQYQRPVAARVARILDQRQVIDVGGRERGGEEPGTDGVMQKAEQLLLARRLGRSEAEAIEDRRLKTRRHSIGLLAQLELDLYVVPISITMSDRTRSCAEVP